MIADGLQYKAKQTTNFHHTTRCKKMNHLPPLPELCCYSHDELKTFLSSVKSLNQILKYLDCIPSSSEDPKFVPLTGMHLGIAISKSLMESGTSTLTSLAGYLTSKKQIVDDDMAYAIALWLHESYPEKFSSDTLYTAPVQRFIGLLSKTHINKPLTKVLTRISDQFYNRLVCVFTSEQALDLYEHVKNFPGSTTETYIEQEAGIKLNGPYDTNLGAKLITGADEMGTPILVKVFTNAEDKSTKSEVMAVDKLKLENPIVALVPAKVCSVTVKGTDEVSQLVVRGIHTCIIMPHYPTDLTKIGKLLSLQCLYAGGMKIREALQYVHKQGLVHMDVKPHNIFVGMEGNWVLGDYGSCVKIGEIIHSCSREYLPENVLGNGTPARCGFDSFMLASSLVCLAASYEDIRHQQQLLTDKSRLLQATASIQHECLRNLIFDLVSEYME